MRNLLIGVLLAGAAVTPAIAQDNGDHRWHHDQQQNGKADGGHQQRQQAQPQQQQVRQQGPRFNGGDAYRRQQAPQFVPPQQQVQVQQGQRGGWNRQGFGGRQNVAPQSDVRQQAYQYRGPAQVQQNRNGGWTRSYPQGNVVQQQYQQRTWNRDAYRQGQMGQQYQQRYSGNGGRYAGNGGRYAGNWDRNWRNNSRYDWRRYRDRNRSVFQLGLYVDPFGYGYQPFGIGYELPPVYFGQQYWIDPAMFDLPYPPPGTQWVRYWNDALLVDMETGQVVDAIQGFFL